MVICDLGLKCRDNHEIIVDGIGIRPAKLPAHSRALCQTVHEVIFALSSSEN
jgi:hypothetical protein